MSKRPHLFLLFSLFIWSGCYEPTEGCLSINAVNYNVSADDACGDCCTFPSLTLSMQHIAKSSTDSTAFRYGVFYKDPIKVNSLDSFLVDRARFFISNLQLISENDEVVTVIDTLRLGFSDGTSMTIPDNFAKLDRDIFQARKVGTILSQATIKEVQFTVGLEEFLREREIISGLPSGHPLLTDNDSLIYETGIGYTSNLLIVRKDTMPTTDSLIFRYFEPQVIQLPLAAPFTIKRGFNVKLTLRANYLEYFAGVDFQNDSFQTMQEKISNNLVNVFSVTEIKVE